MAGDEMSSLKIFGIIALVMVAGTLVIPVLAQQTQTQAQIMDCDGDCDGTLDCTKDQLRKRTMDCSRDGSQAKPMSCGNIVASNAVGSAPNSGDGVSDGSGLERPDNPGVGPAPNSGDGIPDGSGF